MIFSRWSRVAIRARRSRWDRVGLTLVALGVSAAAALSQEMSYPPSASASKIVTVTRDSSTQARIVVLTEGVAIKENGPKETLAQFGEVYAFSPNFLVVYRDEPTTISFWNLQPDDEHDLMLVDSRYDVMMKEMLPPLKDTSLTFTFHQEGLFPFYCTMHPPAMSGQILVLPPRSP